ncbi:MAG: hypothetical protein NTX13_00495 [Acidobacteria bacterium]|nr:hypothetical protein [Acidobacteriota bacterium]
MDTGILVVLFMTRLLAWALLLFALIPSAWFAVAAWELPQLGAHGEDGAYYNAALALSEGRGYRATSVPGEPLLTRFPPGLPALLAPFAQSRALLSLLLWMLAPCALGLLYSWGRQQGLDLTTAALVCLPVGAFRLFAQGSANVLPDVLALVLVLAAVYVVEVDSGLATLLGAVAAAAAYLTSDVLLPGLCAMAVFLVIRRRYLQAAIYAVVLLSTALAWRLYVATYAEATALPLYGWYTGRPSGLQWANAALDVRTVLIGLVVAAVWRLQVRLQLSALGCYAVGQAVALQFAGTGSSVLTLVPVLAIAATTLPLPRVLLGVAYLAGLAALPGALGEPQRHRAFYPVRNQAYFWIESNTPLSAQFLAYNSALLHAATWRHGVSPQDRSDPTSFALEVGLDYLLATPLDPAAYQKAVRADPFYETVYEHDGVLIRRRRP